MKPKHMVGIAITVGAIYLLIIAVRYSSQEIIKAGEERRIEIIPEKQMQFRIITKNVGYTYILNDDGIKHRSEPWTIPTIAGANTSVTIIPDKDIVITVNYVKL